MRGGKSRPIDLSVPNISDDLIAMMRQVAKAEVATLQENLHAADAKATAANAKATAAYAAANAAKAYAAEAKLAAQMIGLIFN